MGIPVTDGKTGAWVYRCPKCHEEEEHLCKRRPEPKCENGHRMVLHKKPAEQWESDMDLEAIARRVKKGPAAGNPAPHLWALVDALDTNGESQITSDQIVQVIAELE